MEHRATLKLLVLFLSFSFVVSSAAAAAVPTLRSLKSFKDDLPIQDFLAQGEIDMRIDGELSQVHIEGRMNVERIDYNGPGDTGANHDHDPKPPRRP